MRRAADLEPGDVTPHFTVEEITLNPAEFSLFAGNGEVAIRTPDGPVVLVASERLVEVTGCTGCGPDHGEGDCPRRSLAPDVSDDRPLEEQDAEYVAARMRAEPTGAP